MLLAGSAGSGKTTVAIHRLAAAALQAEPPAALYLSYSPALVEHARGLYRDLVAAQTSQDIEARPRLPTSSPSATSTGPSCPATSASTRRGR